MIEVRSYRRVFDLERRIYSVDRVRLNPGGVPVRGVVYFLAVVALDLIVAGLPLLGSPLVRLPWYLRDIALPGAIATVLGAIRIEGRVFHLAAQALVRYWAAPRRAVGATRRASVGKRWAPRAIVILPDGSDSRLRRLRYTGPGVVLVSVEHERRGRATELGTSGRARPGLGAVLRLQQPARARALERGQVIALGPNARLLVRSRAVESE
jgi:hypothetical protein